MEVSSHVLFTGISAPFSGVEGCLPFFGVESSLVFSAAASEFNSADAADAVSVGAVSLRDFLATGELSGLVFAADAADAAAVSADAASLRDFLTTGVLSGLVFAADAADAAAVSADSLRDFLTAGILSGLAFVEAYGINGKERILCLCIFLMCLCGQQLNHCKHFTGS